MSRDMSQEWERFLDGLEGIFVGQTVAELSRSALVDLYRCHLANALEQIYYMLSRAVPRYLATPTRSNVQRDRIRSSSGDAPQHRRGTTTEIAMMTDHALWSLLKDRGHEWAG